MPPPAVVGSLIILVSPFLAAGIGWWLGRQVYRGELSRAFVSIFVGVAMFSGAWGMLMDFGKWLGSP